jgi:hypothetical protein
MINYIKQFNEQKFVYLPDFLDKTNCVELTNEFQKLHTEGKTEVDTQCPKSFSVYGAEVFDRLLEQLCPHFEEASGLKLYPTYSYARIYQPGETLKIHRDRDSCEISVTLTLNMDENCPWDILFGCGGTEEDHEYSGYDEDDNLTYLKDITTLRMKIGDAVLYRGKEIYHWREEYQGKQHVQVFLHYVDANGPCASSKYDGREKLSHHSNDDQVFFWYYKDGLPLPSCSKLIESIENNVDFEEAKIGANSTGVIDKEVRNVKKYNMPVYRGIGATLAGMGLNANHQVWKFDVTHADQTDYLKYEKGGHYKEHIDTFFKRSEKDCRKLTVLAFLNDDYIGGKLFLKIGDEKMYPPQEAGTVLIFPSFILHGVEPVISGTRRSIVTWIVGPSFK